MNAGRISGGISVNTSRTYAIDDVTISNRCSQNTQSGWNFSLAAASTSYAPFYTACTSMHEGAQCGRETFTAGTDCIISFQEASEAPQMISTNNVTIRSSCGKAGQLCGEENRTVTLKKTFTLPFLQASDFD